MSKSANAERQSTPGSPSRRRQVQRELMKAMREAVFQRANRRGLTQAELRRRIRARGLDPACFFLGKHRTISALVKAAEAVGCRPVVRLQSDQS